MGLEQQSLVHTGEERYEVTLTYSKEDQEHISRLTATGDIVPDTVVLVWVRQVGEAWRRHTNGQHGSRAIGHEKLAYQAGGGKGIRRSREIFTPGLGEIKRWAEYLPGLRNAVAAAEDRRPTPSLVRAQEGLTR